MKLENIYAPVRQELEEVERNLIAATEVDPPFLAQLLKHILINGGKRIRPALTLLCGKFYHYETSLLVPAATGIELLHTATLVHDDIVDNSEVRRGKPTINSLWGDATAILLGDYLFAQAATFVATTGNTRVIKLFSQTLAIITSGELEQGAADFNLRQKRQHYYRWISAKTACLFSAAAESGAILSQAPEGVILTLKEYGYNLGMAFQVVDDILDFIGDEREMGKPVAADLSQGVLTLPVILLLESYPKHKEIREVLEKKDTEVLKQVIEQIRQPSIINQCFNIASDFGSKAVSALQTLPDNNIREALFNLVEYCLQRKK